MRRVRVLPLVFGATALVACAALLDIRDLTVADAGTSDASASCDAPSGSVDDCLVEGGVMMLSTKGELNALYRASGGIFGSGVLYVAGWTQVGTSTSLTVQAFSYAGEAGAAFYSDPAKSGSVASAMTVSGGALGTGYLCVVGNSAFGVLVESFDKDLQRQGAIINLTDASVATAALTEAVAVDSDGVNLHVYGRALVGTVERAFVLRINPRDSGIDQSALMNGTARAYGGLAEYPDDANDLVDILADLPDAGHGALTRFTAGLGVDSVLSIPFADGSVRAIDTDMMPLSGYYVAGQAPGASGFVVAHVNHNGTLDTSFGSGGVLVAPGNNRGANALLVDGDHLWLAGFDNGKAAVARVLLDAGLDPAFGEGGVMTFGFDGELRAIILIPGHVVAGGFANSDAGPTWALVWIVR